MCKISIIIVNYNVKYFLEQCLLSIKNSVLPFPIEVFVVDNASKDGSIDYLREKFPDVKYIENDNNIGFSAGNNIAIKQAAGEYVLLLNPDTVLGENVLKNVAKQMDDNPDIGACGVKMINAKGEFLVESKRGFPTPWASFCKIFGLARMFPHTKLFDSYNLGYLDKNTPHNITILSGAFMFMRKSAIDKAGLLDETFFMYGEDIDLSYRIIQAGYRNYYLPESIIHYKGESTDKNDVRYVRVFYEAMSIFYKKHYGNQNKLFSNLVQWAINYHKTASKRKRIFPLRRKVAKPLPEVILSRNNFTFGQIIDQMSKRTGEAEFLIHSPETEMIIGSRKIKRSGDERPFSQ